MKTVCKLLEKEESVIIKFRDGDKITYQDFPFINYFYVLEEEFDQVSYLILPKASDIKTVVDRKGVEYIRIYLKNNYHRNMLRNEIEDDGVRTFEADINAPKRLLIENQDFPLHQEGLKFAFYDIETDDRKPFVKDKKAEIVPLSAITSLVVKDFERDGDGIVWYIRNEGIDGPVFDDYRTLRRKFANLKGIEILSEEQKIEVKEIKAIIDTWEENVSDALFHGEEVLLKKYFEYIVNYDVVSAWNGTKFDDAWIRFRAKAHKMNYDALNLVGFDYLESYKKNHYGAVKSFKLNDIAYEELRSQLEKEESNLSHPEEIKKLDWKVITGFQKYFEMFLLNPQLHKEYNIQDVNLLDMLEKKLGFLKLHFTQCLKAHCLLIDTLYSSRICDIMVLNEANKRKIIKISKPTEQVVKDREKEIAPGGYTTCRLTGLHWNVHCFDFASHYVNVIRSFNISSENYIRNVKPDLSKVFNEQEIIYINYCINEAKGFVDKQNKFAKKKYEKHIEEKRILLNVEAMEKLMWKFVRNYDNKIEHNENECFTPADLNLDTRGWNMHNHFVFDKTERAIYPNILDDLSIERDEVKYSLKNYEKGTFEWDEHNYYQLGLKLLGNAYYGYTLYRASRDYRLEIGTSITSSARYLTKLCMLEVWNNDMDIILSDTDSAYCIGDKSIEFMDKKFKELLDENLIKFNTMFHNEKYHTINFEYEETYEAVIPVKKKRYYYLKDGKIGGKGGIQTRSDVLQIAKDLQKELLNDIFFNKFDREYWKDKLFTLKEKVSKFELEEKHIIRISGLGKPIEEYGKPMMDGETGLQKMTKDGNPRFAPIPANVQIAKRLIEEGENIEVGDKIQFVVLRQKPKIFPITISEYRKDKSYDTNYYYEKIIKGLLEILSITHKDDVYRYFSDCWLFSSRQIKSLLLKQEDD